MATRYYRLHNNNLKFLGRDSTPNEMVRKHLDKRVRAHTVTILQIKNPGGMWITRYRKKEDGCYKDDTVATFYFTRTELRILRQFLEQNVKYLNEKFIDEQEMRT